MQFEELPLLGAFLIKLDLLEDARGFFARSFCKNEFEAHGLQSDFVQCNVSYNRKAGTLRGFHYQVAPHAEVKVVSCPKGAIFDVIVDLRVGSATYGQWVSCELNDQNHHMLYIPEGFAHGFQTLTDDTEVFYLMGHFFHPESARGLYWDDLSLKVTWPIRPPIISERDQSFPRLSS